jgi:hypothetical protein
MSACSGRFRARLHDGRQIVRMAGQVEIQGAARPGN